jgi:hypothetical protein
MTVEVPGMRGKVAYWTRQALFMLIGGWVGYTAVHFSAQPDASLFVRLLVLASAFVLMIIVHELGHVAGAKIAGWKVHLFAVGPFLLRTAPLRLSFAGRMIGGDVGGFVLALPHPDQNWRDGALPYYAGGIVACLALAAAASGLFLMSEAAGWSGLFSRWLLYVALFSFSIGAVVNAIPWRTEEGSETDGASILDHLRGRDMPGPMHSVAMILGQAMAGIRPRDWDPRLVAELQGMELTGKHGGMGAGALYSWYLDVGDFPAAEAALTRSMQLLGRLPSFVIEEAFMAAYVHTDGERARRLLDEVPKKGLFEPHARWRAEAATRYAAGDAAGSLAAVAEARKSMARPLFVATDDDRDILDEIERRANVSLRR